MKHKNLRGISRKTPGPPPPPKPKAIIRFQPERYSPRESFGIRLVAGLIGLLLLTWIGRDTYADYKVYTEGDTVQVTIVGSESYGSRGGRAYLYTLDGVRHSAHNYIGSDLRKGQVVSVLFQADYPEHALKPGYDPLRQDFILLAVLVVFFPLMISFKSLLSVSAARRGRP